ncbi:PAS domain S-box-containing protein [Reichenbachiella faecimaris]|uniref:histidine kinase n=1 Tax=Reichenbachiella faecimaris TaxID=692418 RepID=A0A1W2GH77_REIFA|nr:ATP-binding protein [Reichenbachiella faecimaris]SMD36015.1 PAS domain S-box-containing protein [Reichenbachiella faecimaris]
MAFADIPIRRKLLRAILFSTGTAILITCTAYFAYELFSFRQTSIRELSIVGEIIATNSTAALAFNSKEDAYEMLSSLKVDKSIEAACLYDKHGNIFTYYPEELSADHFPDSPKKDGYRIIDSGLIGIQPVIEKNRRLGTLYLRSNMNAFYFHMQLYAGIAGLVIVFSFVLSYLLSRKMQSSITNPILELADTALAISDRKDYKVRATKHGNDEIGLLTDAFNQMLDQIQDHDQILRENEERFESTLDNMLEGCHILDFDWRYVYLNDSADRHNKRPKEELLGKRYTEAWPGVETTEVFSIIKRCLEEETNSEIENEFIFPNGTSGWFKLAIRTIPEGVFILSEDITDKKNAENRILNLNEELEQKVRKRTSQLEVANKELESFTYSVSHDLRAPLRSVIGYSQIVLEDYLDKLDEEGVRILKVIISNATKMGQLIDDLLAFSKIGKQELSKRPLDMEAIVAEAIDENQYQSERANIVMKEMIPAEGDKSLIKQVVANLVSNALKYSGKEDAPLVEIGSYQQNKNNIYYFKDNGVGFDMKYYDKLFGVFERLHKSAEFEGTGVGLALVQRITAKHNGKVWAEGALQQGATFYFSLPTQPN